MKYKYQIRRIIAAFIILMLLPLLVSVMIKKSGDVLGYAIDGEIQRQEAILEEHKQMWGIEKWIYKKDYWKMRTANGHH